jgi:hypothetical protein
MYNPEEQPLLDGSFNRDVAWAPFIGNKKKREN